LPRTGARAPAVLLTACICLACRACTPPDPWGEVTKKKIKKKEVRIELRTSCVAIGHSHGLLQTEEPNAAAPKAQTERAENGGGGERGRGVRGSRGGVARRGSVVGATRPDAPVDARVAVRLTPTAAAGPGPKIPAPRAENGSATKPGGVKETHRHSAAAPKAPASAGCVPAQHRVSAALAGSHAVTSCHSRVAVRTDSPNSNCLLFPPARSSDPPTATRDRCTVAPAHRLRRRPSPQRRRRRSGRWAHLAAPARSRTSSAAGRRAYPRRRLLPTRRLSRALRNRAKAPLPSVRRGAMEAVASSRGRVLPPRGSRRARTCP
jgi:hypothetical protein